MSRLWFEVGRALRQLILGSVKRVEQQPASPRKRGADAKRAGSASNPTIAGNGRSTPTDLTEREFEDASPGRYGDGRTRDLTPREFTRARFEYAPDPDGDPDPGEVIWTWVPYVENDGRGKDRPVLIIGRLDETAVVGCYLSTKHHRDFISIGRGEWDPQRRESFVSPERLLRITHEGMRRESVQVDRQRFETVVAGVLDYTKKRGDQD